MTPWPVSKQHRLTLSVKTTPVFQTWYFTSMELNLKYRSVYQHIFIMWIRGYQHIYWLAPGKTTGDIETLSTTDDTSIIRDASVLLGYQIFSLCDVRTTVSGQFPMLRFQNMSGKYGTGPGVCPAHRWLQAVLLLRLLLPFLSELQSKAAWSRPKRSLIFSQPYNSPYLSITWQEKKPTYSA